jgi:hypothetical protein
LSIQDILFCNLLQKVLSNEKRKRKILICEVHATGLISAINPDFGPFNNYGPEARLILSVHIPNQRLISILRCIKTYLPKPYLLIPFTSDPSPPSSLSNSSSDPYHTSCTMPPPPRLPPPMARASSPPRALRLPLPLAAPDAEIEEKRRLLP